MTKLGYPPCLPDIVEEHFEELDFLWEQREGVIFAPDWTLADLAELEERAEAHLDGLRLAELNAVDLARPHLSGEKTFAATAATFVLMETGEQAFVEEVVDALEGAAEAPERRDGIRIGLRHAPVAPLFAALCEMSGSDDLALAIAAADVLTFHRASVESLERLLEAELAGRLEREADRALVWGALGRAGRGIDEARLRAALAAGPPTLGRAALRAAAHAGLPGLEALCRDAALDPRAPSQAALCFLGAFGEADDLPLLAERATQAACAPAAISALGALGRLEAVPLLIALMRDDAALAPLAADAFTRITGVDDIRAEAPADAGVAGEEAAEEDDVDAGTPPDPDRAEAWWAEQGRVLDRDARWQAGVRIASPAGRCEIVPLGLRRDVLLAENARRGQGVLGVELEARAVLQREA